MSTRPQIKAQVHKFTIAQVHKFPIPQVHKSIVREKHKQTGYSKWRRLIKWMWLIWSA